MALGASLTADHVVRIQGLLAESAQSGAQPQYVLATYSLAELCHRRGVERFDVRRRGNDERLARGAKHQSGQAPTLLILLVPGSPPTSA